MNNKVLFYIFVSMLYAVNSLQAQNTSGKILNETISPASIKLQDSLPQHWIPDTTGKILIDTTTPKSINLPENSAQRASSDNTQPNTEASSRPAKDSSQWQLKDVTESKNSSTHRDLDTRWFVSPLCKFQVQDFGLIEKNHDGYLSNANNLSFPEKSNLAVSLSAYKNITTRISFSADLGIAYGHVTSSEVMVSQTSPKTYNVLNATVYYHLLPASYQLQPFVSLGINDVINTVSYPSAPLGVGVKFNSKKIMLMGQAAYGYSVSKNIANTMMYSVGMYLPITNKKKRKEEADEASAPDQSSKKGNKKEDKNGNKKDSSPSDTARSVSGSIVNNIYININMDSLLNARKHGSSKGGDAEDDHFDPLDLHEFTHNDYKIDSVNGRREIKFVVYFEFNMYSLNSGAFAAIDKVLSQIHRNPGLNIEIKGYTDDVGTTEYNIFLSRMRAQMVYDYMNSRGIPSDQMSFKYYGKENPVADNNDPNTSWLNRRAEIVIRKK